MRATVELAEMPRVESQRPSDRKSAPKCAAPSCGRRGGTSHSRQPSAKPPVAPVPQPLLKSWLHASTLVPTTGAIRRFTRRFNGRPATLDELLRFARKKLAAPALQLVAEHGDLGLFHALRPGHGLRPADWRWQLGLLTITTKYLPAAASDPTWEDALRLAVAVSTGSKTDDLLRAQDRIR